MSLKEPLFCRLCHEKYSAYESVRRKLKKDNICLGRHIQVEKPYKLFLYDYCANLCGSTRLWKVSPKASKIRLHTLAHYEYVLPVIYRNEMIFMLSPHGLMCGIRYGNHVLSKDGQVNSKVV